MDGVQLSLLRDLGIRCLSTTRIIVARDASPTIDSALQVFQSALFFTIQVTVQLLVKVPEPLFLLTPDGAVETF